MYDYVHKRLWLRLFAYVRMCHIPVGVSQLSVTQSVNHLRKQM